MKNQGVNKNRNNTFDSNEFIHFTVDLKGPLFMFHILLSSTYGMFIKKASSLKRQTAKNRFCV